MEQPRKGSRTYRILMNWKGSGSAEPVLIDPGQTFRDCKKFLDDLQKAWHQRGLKAHRVSIRMVAIGEQFLVWFEEEKEVRVDNDQG